MANYGHELLVDEHVIIKRVLKVVKNIAYGILKGEEICYEDFAKIIVFIREFADAHHHGKEEKILFTKMEEEIGELVYPIIRNGMLVEHDLGRLYIANLEIALEKVKSGEDFEKINVIANAVGYANLLERHIAKEDEVVYVFASNKLSSETWVKMNEDIRVFEDKALELGVQAKYMAIVEELEKKYN